MCVYRKWNVSNRENMNTLIKIRNSPQMAVPERNDATRANLAREVQTSWQKQQPIEPSEEEVVDGINEDQSEKRKGLRPHPRVTQSPLQSLLD
jgi:hypothetical protein